MTHHLNSASSRDHCKQMYGSSDTYRDYRCRKERMCLTLWTFKCQLVVKTKTFHYYLSFGGMPRGGSSSEWSSSIEGLTGGESDRLTLFPFWTTGCSVPFPGWNPGGWCTTAPTIIILLVQQVHVLLSLCLQTLHHLLDFDSPGVLGLLILHALMNFSCHSPAVSRDLMIASWFSLVRVTGWSKMSVCVCSMKVLFVKDHIDNQQTTSCSPSQAPQFSLPSQRDNARMLANHWVVIHASNWQEELCGLTRGVGWHFKVLSKNREYRIRSMQHITPSFDCNNPKIVVQY